MTFSWRLARALFVAAAVLATFLVASGTALASHVPSTPGLPKITVEINDSASGATYDQHFDLAYSDQTDDGTPVYVYVPEGALAGVEGVPSLDPHWDPDPTDDFVPCADASNEDYVITQPQINELGNELAESGGIVEVDEDHFGPIGGDPTDSEPLVVLVYNVQDSFLYDCAEDSYTAGYFAPAYLDTVGNVIVIDAYDWANRQGAQAGNADGSPFLIEGIIAHELEHLVLEYADANEVSWVNEGLADMAIFLNAYPAGGSHVAYHQVFHRETSLTRWGGGLENYGAAFTYFLYLWERAGGNGDGTFTPDEQWDNAGGDLLIKRIFQEQADGLEGVQNAITWFNANNGMGTDLPSAATLFQDWVVAVYLDAEGTKFDFRNLAIGSEVDSWGYTVDLANDIFWDGRGIYKGAMPEPRWRKGNVPAQLALPYGTSYERFTNAGSSVAINFSGQPGVDIDPPGAATGHWWGGYENGSENLLNVGGTFAAGDVVNFDSWYFIEEGWDYGYVEYSTNGGTTWEQLKVFNAANAEITTDTNPHGNNTEGEGITGTSGGAYFVDEPEYIGLHTEPLPAGVTDVRFRYSTDAGYLDTGWFVANVRVGGTERTLTPEEATGHWQFINGPEQDNNWSIQVIAPCDLTPGRTGPGEEIVAGGNYVYRFMTDAELNQAGFDLRCTKGGGKPRSVVVAISNMPTGAMTFFDSPYTFRLTNTGSGAKTR